jgi:hypothetical protein
MSEDLTKEEAIRILDALRDGIAPDEGLDVLTVGREKWIASITDDLEHIEGGASRLRIFNGRYGDGKTHLMKVTKAKALSKGYAVSYLSVSKDLPLNRWDLIYRSLVRALHTKNSNDEFGLCAILNSEHPDPYIASNFRERSEKVRLLSRLNPDFATAIYRYSTRQGTSVDTEQDMLLLRNWLEGQKMSARQVQSLGISSSIDRNNGHLMFDSIVQCLKYYGFQGMVLLIDEVESTRDQSTPVRSQAYENLRLIIDRERLPKHCLVVFSTTPEMFTDTKKGFQSYPALWRRIREISTSGPVNFRSTVVDLTRTPLEENDLLSIGKKIRHIHSIGRNWTPSRVTDAYLQAGAHLAVTGELGLIFSPTAVYIKLINEDLDIAEQNPSYKPSTNELRRRFQQLDQALYASHSTESWSA